MGALNGLSWETSGFFHYPNPHWFLQPEVWDFIFPVLEPWAARCGLGLGSLARYLSWFLYITLEGGTTLSAGHCRHHHTTTMLHPLPSPCPGFPSPPLQSIWMNYDFFKSMVVGLPYSLIFWQFWVFFVLRLVVILLMCLCKEEKCVYLHLHLDHNVEYFNLTCETAGLCLYFYFFTERKRGRKRGRETPVCGCLSCTPHRGPGLQPRHVPWLGIEPGAPWFTGRYSIHWATPARAELCLYYLSKIFLILTLHEIFHYHLVSEEASGRSKSLYSHYWYLEEGITL